MGWGIFVSKDNQSNRNRLFNYRMHVRAAVKGSKDLQCTITPKVHLMLEHVEWQMTNIRGGVR